jgi:hypothetical protein
VAAGRLEQAAHGAYEAGRAGAAAASELQPHFAALVERIEEAVAGTPEGGAQR